MQLNALLERTLVHARGFTEAILKDLTQPQDWIVRVPPTGNHALWVVGHLTLVENNFLGMVDPGSKLDFGKYTELFGRGTVPVADLGHYPLSADLLQVFRERRTTLLKLLQGLREADFLRATPEGAPPFIPDVAAVFQIAAWHEGLHAGQLSAIRRSLGHAPIR